MSIFDDLENYKPDINFGLSNEPKQVESNVNPQEAYINKIKEANFNTEKLEPILKTGGNQLIISGAGSGKTTMLVFQIQNDLITGEAIKYVNVGNTDNPVGVADNILVCTFSKAGAKELKDRLLYWQTKWGYTQYADSISFKTLHAEFYDVLRKIGCQVKLAEDKVYRRILEEYCKKYRIVNSKTGYLSSDDYRNIEGIITYARNRLDRQRYNAEGVDDYCLTPTILDSLLYDMKAKRREMGIVDYEDLQEILFEALKVNTALQKLVASRYSIIYIDEFQDTSQIQYEIMKYYFRGVKKVVVIGDDDQTIYSWRGSDINIITKRFVEDYQPTIQKLDVNFRCPSNILEPVIPSIEMNKNRHNKTLKSYNEGGELSIMTRNTVNELTKGMLERINEDLTKGYNIGILVRINYDGLYPAFALQMARKYNYNISSKLMTADTPLPRFILSTTSFFTDRCSPSLYKTLEMLVNKQSKYQLRSMYEMLKSNITASIWTISKRDMNFSIPELSSLIELLKGVKEQNGELVAYQALLLHMKDNVYNSDSQYCFGARNFIDFMYSFIDIEIDKGVASINDMVSEFKLLNSEVGARIKSVNKAKIEICTVHEAKGREWDSVYIFNDIDGCFPSSQATDFEEERRIHYIAWTRAKKSLTVTTVEGLQSPFLYECAIPREARIEKIVTKTLTKNKPLEERSIEEIFSA